MTSYCECCGLPPADDYGVDLHAIRRSDKVHDAERASRSRNHVYSCEPSGRPIDSWSDNPMTTAKGDMMEPPKLWIQFLPGIVVYKRDPRKVHDNGKPIHVYVPLEHVISTIRAVGERMQMTNDLVDAIVGAIIEGGSDNDNLWKSV